MTQSEYDTRVGRHESFLMAQDGQFLGTLTSNKYQFDSVMNPYGRYGSKYSSTSIFNQYGRYGGRFAQYSPFNPYTRTPPKIIFEGNCVGLLTINENIINGLNPECLFCWIRNKKL